MLPSSTSSCSSSSTSAPVSSIAVLDPSSSGNLTSFAHGTQGDFVFEPSSNSAEIEPSPTSSLTASAASAPSPSLSTTVATGSSVQRPQVRGRHHLSSGEVGTSMSASSSPLHSRHAHTEDEEGEGDREKLSSSSFDEGGEEGGE